MFAAPRLCGYVNGCVCVRVHVHVQISLQRYAGVCVADSARSAFAFADNITTAFSACADGIIASVSGLS